MPLTNEQYGQLEKEYQRRRRESELLLEERRREINEALPAYRNWDRERHSLQIARARASLGGKKEEAAGLDREMKALAAKKNALLEAAGYPQDYLEPVYTCPLCRDTGYVEGEKCRCLKQLTMELLYHDSPLWTAARQENFKHFRMDLFSEQPLPELGGKSPRDLMMENKRLAREYVRNFAEKGGNLFLTGPAGTGKTFLCNCIASSLMEEGYAILYMTAAEFFEKFSVPPSFEDKSGLRFAEVMDAADLLILDDLNTEANSRAVPNLLFRTVNERLLKRKATILSTNRDIEEIREAYTERVSSRIVGGYRKLQFGGPDLRIKRKTTIQST